MEYEYDINHAQKFVHIRVRGMIDAEQLIEIQKEISSDSEFDSTYNSLIDLSEVVPSHNITLEKIEKGIAFIKSIQRERGKCKWAFIESKKSKYGFIHLFALIAKGLKIRIKVFSEEKSAREWLNG